MDGIFISYRRDDSAGYAGRLYDRLAAHFGAERVFMDVEGIEPGLDFVVAIEEAVGSCRVLIAVIGDEWTTATDAAGRRRLDDPNDFIRLETGSALQRGIRVVPVLVGGAVMPLPADLPDDLKALTRRQAIEINHKQWEASTGELIHTLEGILKVPSADPAPKEDKPKDPIPAGLDGKGSANGGKAKPVADDQGREDGGGKGWILPAAALLALLAGIGLWLGQGERKPATAPEAPVAGKPAEVPVAKPSRPLARVEREPVPEEKPPASPAPSPPAAAPAPAVKPESRPATAVAAPLIREFKAEATARLARLCYRVSDAESLSLSPRPGELRNLTEDCVEVRIDGPTNFTLLARNGGKTVRKMLAVAPPGATAGTQTETPGAVAGQPAATGRSAAVLPVKGERWVYKASGKWPTSFKQRFEILAQSVADSLVTDELRVLDGAGSPEQRRSRGGKPDFVAWTVIGMEFSPYFGAYVDLARQESLGSLPTPDYDPQWRDWHSKVEVLGRESVSVPAGTFDAFKVEVWSNRRQTGSAATLQVEPVRVRYTIWYAPQVKRYVRMQRTVVSANNSEIESDLFELVAHRGQ